jgi:phage terminase large subunit GpA-like protein
LTIIGANAPAGLSARPIRIVIGDEVDRWPVSAGTEGDPLKLAAKRQQTFWNRKNLIGSTPVRTETSVIWREYLASDQRRFHVPCPDCEVAQTLRWEQVRWDKDEAGEHMPEGAHYVCEHCGAIWDDAQRQAAIQKGSWRAARTGKYAAGFHIPGFLSPWLTLEEIVREFLAARNDPQLLQVWVNTVLGEPWEDAVEKVDGASLSNRGENYTPETIPDAALLLVAGIDVQINRLELQLLAFGANEECWVVDYQIFRGDPIANDVWADLDSYLLDSFHTDTGRELRIRAACVDSGGHATASVLSFCRTRWRRKIYAIKGREGPIPIWPRKASKSKTRIPTDLFIVGVDTAKDAVYGRLKIVKPGPGFIHFPASEAFAETYFAQLTSEQVEIRKHEGRPYRVWVLPKKRTNEALDTFVYGLAARHSLRLRLSRALPPAREPQPPEQLPETMPEPAAPAEVQDPPPVREPVRHSLWGDRPGGSWMGERSGGWFKK